MVVSKTSVKDKMLKILKKKEEQKDYYGTEPHIYCSICRKPIEKQDIENLQIEYCKSKINENYAHSECVRKMVKK